MSILHFSMTMPKPRLCASSIAANFILGNNYRLWQYESLYESLYEPLHL